MPLLTDEFRLAALAPRPQELAATGLDERLLADLTAKHLHSAGTLTHAQLSERLGLSGPIVEKVLHFMRREAKVEVKPRLEGTRQLALRAHGARPQLGARRSAAQRLRRPGTGAARGLRQGRASPDACTRARSTATASTKRSKACSCRKTRPTSSAFPSNSGRPVFIYGPAGTGKTYVTHRLARLFRDVVLIPHAIAIDETIVQVFDPLLHKAVGAGDRQSIMLQHGHDARYVACERPVIITGGELTIDLLDVRYEPSSRQYEAPLQLKANNGMFVIDDLGRQKVAPDALLNRWIVPMNERRDYHSLGSGRHFVDAVRRRARVLVEHASARADGRSLPAPHRPQDLLRLRQPRRLRADLGERLRRATTSRSIADARALRHRRIARRAATCRCCRATPET